MFASPLIDSGTYSIDCSNTCIILTLSNSSGMGSYLIKQFVDHISDRRVFEATVGEPRLSSASFTQTSMAPFKVAILTGQPQRRLILR